MTRKYRYSTAHKDKYSISDFFKPETRPVVPLNQMASLIIDDKTNSMAPRLGIAPIGQVRRVGGPLAPHVWQQRGFGIKRLTDNGANNGQGVAGKEHPFRASGAGELVYISCVSDFYRTMHRSDHFDGTLNGADKNEPFQLTSPKDLDSQQSSSLLDVNPFGKEGTEREEVASWRLYERIDKPLKQYFGILNASPIKTIHEAEKVLVCDEAVGILKYCRSLAFDAHNSGDNSDMSAFLGFLTDAIRAQVWDEERVATGRRIIIGDGRGKHGISPKTTIIRALLWAVALGGGSPTYADSKPTEEQALGLAYYPVNLWSSVPLLDSNRAVLGRISNRIPTMWFKHGKDGKLDSVLVRKEAVNLMVAYVEDLVCDQAITGGAVSGRGPKMEAMIDSKQIWERRAMAQDDWSYMAEILRPYVDKKMLDAEMKKSGASKKFH